ncbi:hypothetical protein QYF61_019803 [Mycteria americana]|uniref:Uncharacterized protein n=1 Tax=Mycteria americana TaxID=33587 RepID=A0AAN7RNS8_MYCAM|nr:hypothetical protein QYF61_019803 [Mycteria americana]
MLEQGKSVRRKEQQRQRIRLLKAPSNLTLNTSNDGASTTSLGNLFQCLTTLILKTIAPCPVTTGPGKKSLSTFLIRPLYVLKGHNKVSPEPGRPSPQSPLLQAEQPQLSQPFFIGEVFQPCDQYPLLLTPGLVVVLVHVFLVLGTPKLDAVLQVGSQESGVEGENHLPRPAGHASFDAAQDTIGFLGCECTLLAHVQFFIHQYPQVLLLSAALNPFIPQSVLILGIAPMQVQDLALGFVELQEVPMGPLLKPVQVPLDGIPSLKRINCTTQLGVICKLAEGALSPTVYTPEGHHSLLVSTLSHRAIDCNSLDAAIEPIPYPSNSPSVKPISLHFSGKNVVGDPIKGLTEVQIDDICSSSLVHQRSRSIVEGHQISQA